MPNTRNANAARLEFAPGSLVQSNLSGAAFTGDWLWVIGSHGLKRKNAKPDRDHAENAKRLAIVTLDGNRLLLTCLPIESNASGEASWLVLYDAPGADRKEGEHTIFGDLLRHD